MANRPEQHVYRGKYAPVSGGAINFQASGFVTIHQHRRFSTTTSGGLGGADIESRDDTDPTTARSPGT
jgi:hypothetical protein